MQQIGSSDGQNALLDFIVKMLGDVLTKLQFYRDDAQVACLSVTKSWGDAPASL